jgi:tRNA(fMet)-specific endonuclease VapC
LATTADRHFLLDTNICIYVLDDSTSLPARRLADCDDGSVSISAVTAAELWRWPGLADARQKDMLRQFFDRIPVLPFDRNAAIAYARLPFRRGSFDRLIAAHALACGLTLVTNNERDFAGVAGLKSENWTRP